MSLTVCTNGHQLVTHVVVEVMWTGCYLTDTTQGRTITYLGVGWGFADVTASRRTPRGYFCSSEELLSNYKLCTLAEHNLQRHYLYTECIDYTKRLKITLLLLNSNKIAYTLIIVHGVLRYALNRNCCGPHLTLSFRVVNIRGVHV
jgi:hypothetical protein